MDISAEVTCDKRFKVECDVWTSNTETSGSSTAEEIIVGNSTYLFVTVELLKAPVD